MSWHVADETVIRRYRHDENYFKNVDVKRRRISTWQPERQESDNRVEWEGALKLRE